MSQRGGIQDVKPRHLLLGKSRHLRGLDRGLDDIILEGDTWRGKVGNVVTSCLLTRSIEQASTLAITCQDTNLRLLRSPLLDHRYDVELDGLDFRFTQVSKQGDQLTLTHEALPIARLRQHEGRKKAYRDKVTRAEFVLQLLREVKHPALPAYIPELHKEQPIEETDAGKTKTEVSLDGGSRGQGGLDKGAHLTVKHQPASPQQIKNGETILEVGVSMGAPWQALAASIMAAIQEAAMENLAGGDASSVGIFQIQVPGTASHSVASDVASSARWWFGPGGGIELAKKGLSLTEIAQGVERSAYPSAYSAWQSEAMTWVKAFHGGSLSGQVTTSKTIEKRYAFERKKHEDSWACITRLAGEVEWRAFEAAGIIYYISEPRLLQTKTQMRISEDSQGVDAIDFDLDQGKKVQELNLTVRAKDWAAPPGTPVEVEELGPANGRYLVSEIEQELLDKSGSCTVTIKRREKPLPEPAPETKDVSKSSRFSVGGKSSGGGSLDGISITKTDGPPHWGGGYDITSKIIDPVARKLGMSNGANKEGGHATGGDHDPSVTDAYATDYTPGSGHFANAVARALGIKDYSYGSFDHWGFHCDGQYYECQILWHVEDHYDHVHVGIRKGGY